MFELNSNIAHLCTNVVLIIICYSLALPTVATPHKFCTSFWQVSDKFDDCWFLKSQSHRPKLGKGQEGRRKFLSWMRSIKLVKNLSKTCMKLMWGGHGWTRQTVTGIQFIFLFFYFSINRWSQPSDSTRYS